MTPTERATLKQYIAWATRKDQGAWVLLHWMAQHGACTLRWVPRIPGWVCEWVPDGLTLLGEAPLPEAAVVACARRYGQAE